MEGEKLKQFRESRGYSQYKLAEMVGVRQSMIAMIERGTKAMSLKLAKLLADALECSVEDFL